jgi:hypothetical protein
MATHIGFVNGARAVAADRYADLGRQWLVEFNVTIGKARASLSGRAFVEQRVIDAPWPTTSRKRLYIVAHEIGHIARDHVGRRLPAYIREYQAEVFAHDLLRRDGIAVPRAMTERAKRYVARKAERARQIDPNIALWAGIEARSKPEHWTPLV